MKNIMILLKTVLCSIIFISLFLLQPSPVLAEEPNSSNILKLIKEKLSKWTSIQYTMDIDLGGEPYGYKVYYKSPSRLRTVSWNKKNNDDKVTMIVFKNTTTIFNHLDKGKQTHDTGDFDLFRINNEYDKSWQIEYMGSYDLNYNKDGKTEKRGTWVIKFTTSQGIKYRFWIDKYVGIALRMEVYLNSETPYVIAETISFKLDAPVEDSVFADPF